VRHIVARQTASELDPGGDELALKRAWLYGFYVRCCEEALEATT
jgi:hypothetical protein